MVKKFSSNSRAYTLIELLITVAVMAFIGSLAFFGIRDFNTSQAVSDAQRNFISDLRAAQNKAANGGSGVNFKTASFGSADPAHYTVDGNLVTLPAGVSLSIANPAAATSVVLCFANPYLSAYGASQCGGCAPGSFFACTDATPPQIGMSAASEVTVIFRRAAVSKTVVIKGNGMNISQIYALN